MSKSLYFFAALSFLFLTNSVADTYSSICSSSDCGNGVSIHYPFWVDNTTTATHGYCGYQDFKLKCSDNGRPIITLPSDTYYVTDINYDTYTLTLVDIDVLNQPCPRARHNVTLDPLPLSYNQLDLNLSFYFNCSVPYYAPHNSIGCLENSETSKQSYVFSTGNETDSYELSMDCEEKVVVVVKGDEIHSGELVSEFGGAMKKGFVLEWGKARDCVECEDSEGYCGYNQTSNQMLCFCKDGSIATNRCNKGTFAF